MYLQMDTGGFLYVGVLSAEKFAFGPTGNLQMDGDIDIDGGDITTPADLTITPGGGDVLLLALAVEPIGL